MSSIHRTGVFFNPLQDQWNLSRDMDVNYMMLMPQRPKAG
jgi:2-polyprenyl-6-hydroxyphenyl methylase/3-demethylubiquinone-9 3-methyltransferase